LSFALLLLHFPQPGYLSEARYLKRGSTGEY